MLYKCPATGVKLHAHSSVSFKPNQLRFNQPGNPIHYSSRNFSLCSLLVFFFGHLTFKGGVILPLPGKSLTWGGGARIKDIQALNKNASCQECWEEEQNSKQRLNGLHRKLQTPHHIQWSQKHQVVLKPTPLKGSLGTIRCTLSLSKTPWNWTNRSEQLLC